MRNSEFDGFYAKYRSVITAIARKLARNNDELVQDLEQEGAVALWQLDLQQATSNRDAWIRQAVKFRMIDYLRRQNPKAYESLDARLERGEQLEGDEQGLRLVTRTKTVIRVTHEDEDEE